MDQGWRANQRCRNQDVIGRIKARTEKFKSSFYPHCLAEWNDLDPEIRQWRSQVPAFGGQSESAARK